MKIRTEKLMTTSKTTVMRREALIEGLIWLIIVIINFSWLRIFSHNGTFNKLHSSLNFINILSPFLLPCLLYTISKHCNFIYTDIKNVPYKYILWTIVWIIFVFCLLSPFLNYGLNLTINNVLDNLFKTSYFDAILFFCILKMICAFKYKKLQLKVS